MNALINHIKADKIIRLALVLATTILLLQTIYILIAYQGLPPYLPLFNQLPWGESRLGSKLEVFLPIVITLAFFCVNIFLLARLYITMPLASRILAITTLLMSILSCIFVVRTLLLIV